MPDEIILRAEHLVLELGGKRILDDISLEVWAGHIHAVVGPNGAGKSTLAATVMGLSGFGDYQGELIYDGVSLRGLGVDERARRGIVLSWQEPARFEGLSVERFISAGADPGDASIASRSLELVGLKPEHYLRRAVDRHLSGGERKRVELASILAMQPRLVLLDEPDSGIDVEALTRIFDAIRYLKQRGATVLLITHSPTVLHQAEHGFLLCRGKLVDKGSVSRLERRFGEDCLSCDHQNEPTAEELDGQP